MDKEQFIKLMSEIIKYNKKLDELYESVDDLFGGCDTLMYKTSMERILNVISEIVGDGEAKNISYYIYDCWYGENGDDIDIDGVEYPFKTLEDLWNVIQVIKGE